VSLPLGEGWNGERLSDMRSVADKKRVTRAPLPPGLLSFYRLPPQTRRSGLQRRLIFAFFRVLSAGSLAAGSIN
jgi:hypothetical protein